ncbi:MAG TPA: hypothetical protein VLA25_01240, partial [Methylotenera sp.]|nr:hypothetical protein [Methylotenera sp.]
FNFSNKKTALHEARNLWTQHEITDYTIIINFVNAYYLASFEMEVQDNQVAKIYNIGSPLQLQENSTSTRMVCTR